ncbi:MAG: GHMP family kinase ATP-binding protein [Promethearchaeota archaeon]
MKKVVYSRAPVRICDIGGWTDTWFYPRGAVFNIAVDLFNYIRVCENNRNRVRISSENFEIDTEFDVKNIIYDGKLDLLKAVINRMDINKGIDVLVRSDVPPGCGTGTSASVAVALISALYNFKGEEKDPSEIANFAHQIETDELKLESGVQDQYAAAYGGINFMEIDYPSVKITPVNITKSRIYEYENQLILVYFGSRSSNEMHEAVIKKFKQNDEKVIKAFDTIKNCALEMKKSSKLTLKEIGEILTTNWQAQKQLHPLMTNPTIEKAEKIAKNKEALGFKCNGAGGGGSATVLANPENVYSLKKEYTRNGYILLPCKLNFDGVYSFML